MTNFENEQIKFGNGFDHNWVLNTKGDINQLAAKLTSPTSGITLEVYTNEPGIQVYTGNFLDGTVKGKKGNYLSATRVCLSGNTALSRQPQQITMAFCNSGTGTDLSQPMYL